MRINVKAFSMAAGIVWAIFMFIYTWWMIFLGDGTIGEKVPIFSDIYLMYRINPLGSIVGLLWGFIDGFIGGLLLASFYNLLLGKNDHQQNAKTQPDQMPGSSEV